MLKRREQRGERFCKRLPRIANVCIILHQKQRRRVFSIGKGAISYYIEATSTHLV